MARRVYGRVGGGTFSPIDLAGLVDAGLAIGRPDRVTVGARVLMRIPNIARAALNLAGVRLRRAERHWRTAAQMRGPTSAARRRASRSASRARRNWPASASSRAAPRSSGRASGSSASTITCSRRSGSSGGSSTSLARQAARGGPLIVGPWTSEVGYEALYWVPFLAWAADHYGDLILEHLGEVVRVVKGAGLKPMMWSDMWFTLGGGYGNTEAKVPDEVARQIPPEVQLVYWDYYQKQDPGPLRGKVALHRAMGKEPIFAPGGSGPTTSGGRISPTHASTRMPACSRARTSASAKRSRRCGATMARHAISSRRLNALQHFAEHGYRDRVEDAELRRQFYGATGIDFDAWDTGRQIDITPNLAPTMREWAKQLDKKMPACVEHLLDVRGNDVCGTNPSTSLLWQDPMVGIFDHHIEKLDLANEYKEVAANIAQARKAGPMERENLAFVHAQWQCSGAEGRPRRAHARGVRR